MALFSVFIALLGKSPAQFFELMWRGGFGSWFSVQNTLSRAAPLLLAALCVALPARLGLVVIGGEGAIVLGGVAAAAMAVAVAGAPSFVGIVLMGLAGMIAGGIWIGAVGALRHYRARQRDDFQPADGLYRDRADEPSGRRAAARPGLAQQAFDASARPSLSPSAPSPAWTCIGAWSSASSPACISWVLIEKTRWGFAARIAGGNVRAAQVQGLAVGPLIVGFTALAGAFAGLAGMIEVAAVQGSANGSLAAGYGYTGILVAFLARHNPLAIIPVAILLGGIDASGGLIQRRMDLPDATVQVLQGMIFIVILFSETFYGRFRIFNPDLWKRSA